MPTISFQPILNKALSDYCEQIGVKLDKHPFAEELRGRDSPDDVLKLLEDKANAFKVYRDGNRELINWLSPVIQVVHTLSGVLGEAVSHNLNMRVIVDFVIVGILGTISSSEGNLCWHRCPHHGAYLLTFFTYMHPEPHDPRQPTVSAQATMHLLTCSNVLETSSNAFGSIPMYR